MPIHSHPAALSPDSGESLLTTQEAADFLGMSKSFLERDRSKGRTVPFVRIGSRTVRYQLAALRAYVEEQASTDAKSLIGEVH